MGTAPPWRVSVGLVPMSQDVVGGVERVGWREGAHADGVRERSSPSPWRCSRRSSPGNRRGSSMKRRGSVRAVVALHARRVGDVDRLRCRTVSMMRLSSPAMVSTASSADLLELALTALPDALHGVVDAVGVGSQPTTVGATAQAGAGLHVLEIPVLGRVRVDLRRPRRLSHGT